MRKLIFGLTIPLVMLLGSLSWFNENNQNANANVVDFSKEEIHQKMLNSIDYFNTAKGSFRYWMLMMFYNVQNLTSLIVLKMTDSLSKNEREAVHMLPKRFTNQLDMSHFS